MIPAESVPAYCRFRGGQALRVYNEAAFRHFLAIESRRAERSMWPLVMLLITVRYSDGSRATLNDETAASLFRGLGASIREVDFVGWYREGRVAGAVLSRGINASGAIPRRIAEGLLPELKKRLSADQASNLRVRVVRLGRKSRSASR
jgi:hypothetical protein